jgi:hypothetical protein
MGQNTAEWLEAANALNFLGRTCVSRHSASMQLDVVSWEKELGTKWDDRGHLYRGSWVLNGQL